MTNQKLSVPEIHCDHCKHSIEGAVGALPGVDQVVVDIGERTVDVAFGDDVDLDAIVAAIEEQGYEVAGSPA